MRLIDADDIIYESIDSEDTNRHVYYYGNGIMAVRKEDIDAMPTIAQPEIIRCSDCKHKGTKNCVANAWTTILGSGVKDDFYCGLAERRTDEMQ